MRRLFQVLESTCPELRAEVERGTLIGRLRGFGGASGYLRQGQGDGWALVGDAGYFKDPLTAHGITDALRDAELLSRAVTIGRPRHSRRTRASVTRFPLPLLRITDAVASFSWDLDEIKRLHEQLSALMKAEASHVASLSDIPPLAA